MKKRLVFLAVFLVLTLGATAYEDSCTFAQHGTMRVGDEPGCWKFVNDDGEVYQPVGGGDVLYSDGLSGFMVGTLTPDTSAYCKAGEQVLVCHFEVDALVVLVGTVGYRGGCWTFSSGGATYVPLCTSMSLYTPDLRVRARGVVRPDIPTRCEAGPAVVILDFQIFYPDGGGLGAPSSPHCEIAYAHCLQTCGEMACYTSCETLLQYCNASQ